MQEPREGRSGGPPAETPPSGCGERGGTARRHLRSPTPPRAVAAGTEQPRGGQWPARMGNPGNSRSNQRPKQPDYGPPRVLIKRQYGVCPQSEHSPPATTRRGFRHNAGAKPPWGHATRSSARGCPRIEVWERSELGMATWIHPTDTGEHSAAL